MQNQQEPHTSSHIARSFSIFITTLINCKVILHALRKSTNTCTKLCNNPNKNLAFNFMNTNEEICMDGRDSSYSIKGMLRLLLLVTYSSISLTGLNIVVKCVGFVIFTSNLCKYNTRLAVHIHNHCSCFQYYFYIPHVILPHDS